MDWIKQKEVFMRTWKKQEKKLMMQLSSKPIQCWRSKLKKKSWPKSTWMSMQNLQVGSLD